LKIHRRLHRQFLLSQNSHMTESQIFQLKDEKISIWDRMFLLKHNFIKYFSLTVNDYNHVLGLSIGREC
jgi:hypothetical protein